MPSKISTTKKATPTRVVKPARSGKTKSCGLGNSRLGGIFLIVVGVVCLIAVSARVGIIIYETVTAYTDQGVNFNLSLDTNTSAKYDWDYNVDGDDVIAVETEYKDCSGGDSSCVPKTVYNIKGKKPGVARLSLKYCSTEDYKSCEYATYDFRIDDDLKILESHHGSYFD